MTTYSRYSYLSSDDLCLTLKNESGQLQDAEVFWTIVSAHDNRRVSGLCMKAIRKSVGKYYAPWYADGPTGTYKIRWQYRIDLASAYSEIFEDFFILDEGDVTNSSGHVRGLAAGGTVFETESLVTNLGLDIDRDGIPCDSPYVYWTIKNISGLAMSPRTSATKTATGRYHLVWAVNVIPGEYLVEWEFGDGQTSACLTRKFDVVGPNM